MAALRAASVVVIPIALALFLVAITWPLLTTLERWMPRWAAVAATVLIALLVIAALATVVSLAFARGAPPTPELAGRVQEIVRGVDSWSQSVGLPPVGTPARAFLASVITRAGEYLREAVGLLFLVLGFFALALTEVRDFEERIIAYLRRRRSAELIETVRQIASRVRRHMVALTLSSAVSGLVTGLFTLAIGLELAALWGVLTFLLNYILIFGPFLAVVPPTLYAAVQFDGLTRAALVAGGVGLIQIVMGNFVDPKIEGRVLSLSPAVVLIALVFWGWLWGVPGALLSIPITAALVIVCEHFPQTQWLAMLASDVGRVSARRA